MSMNLPNKITLARIVMIPLFVILILAKSLDYNNIWACAIFCIACISDFLDGYIARKNNLVSNFGKFADPLADKLLVGAALICFVELNMIESWIVIVIISREFIISGVRLVAADNGVVIAASMWGKVKTVVQMIMSIYLMLMASITFVPTNLLDFLSDILKYLSVILTIVSLLDYIYKNRKVFIE